MKNPLTIPVPFWWGAVLFLAVCVISLFGAYFITTDACTFNSF